MSGEKLKVFFYSCLEIDREAGKAHVHSGLHAAKDREKVLDDIAGNFIDPQHISVTEVPELVPTYDENGDPVGFMFAAADDAQLDNSRALYKWDEVWMRCPEEKANTAQPVHNPVDKSEGGEDEKH